MKRVGVIAALAGALLPWSVQAQEFNIQEVPSVAAQDVGQLRPRIIIFSDHRNDELADPGTGLIKFEDWGRLRPLQKQILSLYPDYVEPTINVVVHGQTKRHKEKLHVYVAEARFMLSRPASSIDIARFASLTLLEKIDPSIKHRSIGQAEVAPLKDAELSYNRHPARSWCEPRPASICIESRYQLEGRLPTGIRLANKIDEGSKKISEFMQFQSELRLIPLEEVDRQTFSKLTGIAAPVGGALEQNIFYVNQMMQFGKFLAVLQQHPADPQRSIVTAFMTLAIESDVLDKKKEFETVPVLRNMVPGQVLMGHSTFNTGASISAGLPDYTRNRIKAIAQLLEKGE